MKYEKQYLPYSHKAHEMAVTTNMLFIGLINQFLPRLFS